MKMKGRNKHNIWLLLILLAVVIALPFCNKDIFENYPNSDNEFVEIGKGTIGPEGGTVTGESVEVIIPAGAFDESYEIRILSNDRDTIFSSQALTSTFKVTGLPLAANKKIQIRFPFSGQVDGDTLVAIGQYGYATSLDSTQWVYHGQEANLNNGFVEFEYPDERTKSGQFLNFPEEFNFLLLNGYSIMYSSAGHFSISFPMTEYTNSLQLATIMEAVYDTCTQMGFDMSSRHWPIPVMVKPIDAYGYYSRYITDPKNPTDKAIRNALNWGSFTIDQATLLDKIELSLTASHEFFHFVQNAYEFSDPWAEPYQSWLEEATAVWFEEKFSSDPFYVSAVIPGRENYVFLGMQADSAAHGYGISFIIRDLVQQYGEDVVKRIFQKIKDGLIPGSTVDPTKAILDEINQPIEQYWHELLGAYVEGSFYAGKVNSVLLNKSKSYTKSLTVRKSIGDLNSRDEYQDLSGKLFLFMLDESGGWDADDKLEFKVNKPNDCGVMVLKIIPGGEISLLAETHPGKNGQVTIGDLQSLQDDGYLVIALVTYAHTSKNYVSKDWVDLDVKINTGNSGNDPKIILPEKYTTNFWTHHIKWASQDTIFSLQLVNHPKGIRPEYFVRDIYGSDSWRKFDYQGEDQDTYAITNAILNSMTSSLPPNSTYLLKFRIVLEDNTEILETVDFEITDFFDGITLEYNETSIYPFKSFAPYYLEAPALYMELSISGKTMIGKFDLQDYYCKYPFGDELDSSRIYSTKCDFSITFDGDQVSGTQHYEHSGKYTKRDTIGWNNLPEEFEMTETYTFSHKLDLYYDIGASPGPSIGPNFYNFDISYKNMSGNYSWKMVYYYIDKPDSIATESGQFQTDKYRDYPIYFGGYLN